MEMIKMAEEDDSTILKLYKASMEGSVDMLNSLVQEDPLILNKISLTTLSETPLHVSALLGHVHLTRRLVALRPKLASQPDSRGRLPLHLAAADGHAEVVRALLLLENDDHWGHRDLCSARDASGKTALHYAAMRGHVSVVEVLVGVAPGSVFEELPGGETALHLCARYSHLEALKLLVNLAGDENADFLNKKEHSCGNTVLHLAVALKQTEIVKFLLSAPGVKEDTLNHSGFKASELVDHLTKDFDDLRLRHILMVDHERRSDNDQVDSEQNLLASPSDRRRGWWKLIAQPLVVLDRVSTRWLRDDQMRGSIMIVATLIAQLSFQTAIAPPGGVWQESVTREASGYLSCSEDKPCIAGTAVLAHAWPEWYLPFVYCNSISFMASLGVILLLIGGFPLANKICFWLLSIAMCSTLTFMALTFILGMFLVTPPIIEHKVERMFGISIFIWISLLSFLGLLHIVFVLIRLFKKLRHVLGQLGCM